MSIVVTGATGTLGALTVDALLRRGVALTEIVAAGRNPDRLAELATKGVRTTRIDMDEPSTLADAFEGARKVLLVSVPGNPRRVTQHGTAIDAARAAGVELLAYTSFVEHEPGGLHAAHGHTERLLAKSGVPHVVLRNAVYYWWFTRQIADWLSQGTLWSAAGAGRVSAAAVADLGEAAAAVLTTPGHTGAVYELAGDTFTMADLAAELSRATGRDIPHVELSDEELRDRLLAAGLAEDFVERRVQVDGHIARNDFLVETDDLARLIGRPPVTLSEAMASALE